MAPCSSFLTVILYWSSQYSDQPCPPPGHLQDLQRYCSVSLLGESGLAAEAWGEASEGVGAEEEQEREEERRSRQLEACWT